MTDYAGELNKILADARKRLDGEYLAWVEDHIAKLLHGFAELDKSLAAIAALDTEAGR